MNTKKLKNSRILGLNTFIASCCIVIIFFCFVGVKSNLEYFISILLCFVIFQIKSKLVFINEDEIKVFFLFIRIKTIKLNQIKHIEFEKKQSIAYTLREINLILKDNSNYRIAIDLSKKEKNDLSNFLNRIGISSIENNDIM